MSMKRTITGLLTALALCLAGCNSAQAANGSRLKLLLKGGVNSTLIVPGAGWSGVTPTPGAINGGTTNAIAAWSNVPYETFTDTYTLRVGAAHEPTADQYAVGNVDDITRVAFACEGGPWTSVSTRTGPHDEFEAVVNAASIGSDKQIECRAIAYPATGVPFVLQGTPGYATSTSLLLNANAGGTLPYQLRYVGPAGVDGSGCGTTSGAPCLTITGARDQMKATMLGGDIGGGHICLLAGSYKYGKEGENPTANQFPSATQWVTIEPCAGVSKAAAIINSNTAKVSSAYRGAGFKKLHVKGVTVTPISTSGPQMFTSNTNNIAYFWFDDVTYTGPGVTVGNSTIRGSNFTPYGTNLVASNSYQCFPYFAMLRDSTCHGISADVISNNRAVFGLTVYDVDAACVVPEGGGACSNSHPDTFELIGSTGVTLQNVYFKDITAVSNMQSQIIFNDGPSTGSADIWADFALVDLTLNNQSPSFNPSFLWQWGGVMRHGVVQGVDLQAGNIKLNGTSASASVVTDLFFVNTLCGTDPSVNLSSGVTFFGGTCTN